MGLETVTYISDLNEAWPLGSLPDKKSEGDNHLRNIKLGIKNTFPNVTGAVTPTHTELNFVDGVTSSIQGQLDAKAPKDSPTFTGPVQLPSTTTIGNVSATEIGYLDGVSSSVQDQLDAKANKAGQNYTGAHDFTGGSIAVPTATAGDSSTKAASTAFVASTAFAAALPGQAGNDYKFVTTAASSASWAWPVLRTVIHTANGNLVVGAQNIATTAGITLTVPAGMSARDPIQFMNCSSGAVNINFGAYTVKNQTPDSPVIVPSLRGFSVTNTGSTLA